MSSATRWLIACIEGVAASDLERGATPRLANELLGDHALPELRWPAGGACMDRWLELLDAQHLRRAGWTVDSSSLLLSPPWRGDDSTLRQCARRPGGPAQITCLRLRDQARQGMRHGLGSKAHVEALAKMESHLDRAREILEQGSVPLRCLLLGYAPLQPVLRCFDAADHLQDCLPKGLLCELELHQSPALLHIRFAANEAMARAAELLSQTPAASHGRLLTEAEAESAGIMLTGQEAIFAPLPGVAFHHRALKAAPSLIEPSDAHPCALLPWTNDGRRSAGIEQVAQQLCTEIGLAAENRLISAHAGSAAIDLQASYPDLEGLYV